MHLTIIAVRVLLRFCFPTAGRARSIWDAFCEESGRIVNGDTGDVACDHYSLYEEDVKIMKVRHRGSQCGVLKKVARAASFRV